MTMLLLGWKSGFGQILADLGMKTTVVIGRDELYQFERSDIDADEVIEVRDICDVGRVLPALARKGHGVGGFEVVHTDSELAIVPAAVLAQCLRGRGMAVEVAMTARDKWLQKQAVAAAGVPLSAYTLLPDQSAERDLVLDRISYPALLKPVSSASALNTSYVHNPDEVRQALAKLDAHAQDTESFLVESIVFGPELHVDGLVRHGRVSFASVSRYRTNVLEARPDATVGSFVLDPRGYPGLYDRATALAESALAGMGLRDAAFHLEVFESTDGLVFSECGARTGGSYITDVVRAKFGVDLRRGGFDLALGQAPAEPPPPRPASVGWTYLPAPRGPVVAMPTTEQLLALPGVKQAYASSAEPFVPPPPGAPSRQAGLALVEADDDEQLEQRIATTIDWFRSHVRTSSGGANDTKVCS